ncbi:hypothetical protein RRG08_025839 [Elysia crispata]|uniref:Uncharacterized protein n=1 Tax=Elysia crispata TaxID=231223 RepID=A0AAE0Y309_9GAST|nr:hypothetical protein RRG08_025839 [Elysia crispata]
MCYNAFTLNNRKLHTNTIQVERPKGQPESDPRVKESDVYKDEVMAVTVVKDPLEKGRIFNKGYMTRSRTNF